MMSDGQIQAWVDAINRGVSLADLPLDARDSETVVYAAIKVSEFAYQHASARLRGDFNLTKVAILKCTLALQNASEELRDDTKMVALAVSIYGPILEFASLNRRRDPYIASLAMNNHREAAKYVDDSLKDMVLAKFIIDPLMKYTDLSDGLMNDVDVILLALVSQKISQIHHQDLNEATCKNINDANSDKAKRLLCGEAYRKHHRLKDDSNVESLLKHLDQHPWSLPFMPEYCWAEYDFVCPVIERLGGGMLKYAADSIQKDPVVVLPAIVDDKAAVRFVSTEIPKHTSVIEIAAIDDKEERAKYCATFFKKERQKNVFKADALRDHTNPARTAARI